MVEAAPAQDGYLQIGDAAERTGLTQRTLRYYEEKGLLKSPTRMDGGFRLYSAEDIDRLERIKELKELLGFSLADIREMLESDDIRIQLRSEWRKDDVDATDKAAKMRLARELTIQQIALLDQKAERMAAMRRTLSERVDRYDAWLMKYTPDGDMADSAAKVTG